jgi:hypothetical protein
MFVSLLFMSVSMYVSRSRCKCRSRSACLSPCPCSVCSNVTSFFVCSSFMFCCIVFYVCVYVCPLGLSIGLGLHV